MKKLLEENNVEMHNIKNEGKSLIARRFIRNSKNQIHKHMTAFCKSLFFDTEENIVSDYNTLLIVHQKLH